MGDAVRRGGVRPRDLERVHVTGEASGKMEAAATLQREQRMPDLLYHPADRMLPLRVLRRLHTGLRSPLSMDRQVHWVEKHVRVLPLLLPLDLLLHLRPGALGPRY